MTDITDGLLPTTWEDAVWSAEDWRTVLRAIVSSPHAAVPVADLVAALGLTLSLFGRRLWSRGGANKLKSVNAKNVLLRRAYDPLARDIDAAAFGPKQKDVYTLPSAAHVLAARIELDLE